MSCSRTSHGLFALFLAEASMLAAIGIVHADEGKVGIPIPDARQQLQARESARKSFLNECEDSKTTAQSVDLAKKLLHAAESMRARPAEHYVLLQIAKEIATQAGDADVAIAAIDRIAGRYDMDSLDEKLICLDRVADTAKSSAQREALARQAIPLMGRLETKGQYAAATRLGEIAKKAAQRARRSDLIRHINGRLISMAPRLRERTEKSRLLAQGLLLEAGAIIPKHTPHGAYCQYIPRISPRGIIVVVHGMLGENAQSLSNAERFIKRWTNLADRQGAVILAPAFDQVNFGGREGPGGGYRGLFGRHVGADEFLHEIVDPYQALVPQAGGKFMLYGHSAGGQFVSRYVVKHPDRVVSAVISAAGTFAFPNPNVSWPGGMGRLNMKMRWGSDVQQVNFQPDPDRWLAAATLPITVVVGAKDVEPSEPSPSQRGSNHVERATCWVADMNAYARSRGRAENVQLIVVPDVGHSSSGLTRTCQRALWR